MTKETVESCVEALIEKHEQEYRELLNRMYVLAEALRAIGYRGADPIPTAQEALKQAGCK